MKATYESSAELLGADYYDATEAEVIPREMDITPGMRMAHLDSPQRGFGLLGMQERVASLKGTFKLQSQPQLGVQIHICLPLETA